MAQVAERERTESRQAPVASTLGIRRISWGAIIAGAVLTTAVQLVLTLLGVGIGAATFDAGGSAGAVGLGTGIWFTVAGFISVFCGGWVAGRLAGIPRKMESVLHGVMTWAAGTVFMVFLVSSAIGGLFGGVASILGQSLQVNASSLPAVVSEIQESAGGATADAPTGAQAETAAREGAQPVAGSTLLGFFLLIVGCGAAALGGFYATPKNTVLENLPTFERRGDRIA